MLVAYNVSLEVARQLHPFVARIRKHDNTQAKQLVDAMSSAVRNLAEGAAHKGGNKRAKYEIALGEVNEVRAALDLAIAWGYLTDDSAVREPLGRLLALCYGLVK